VIVLAQTDIGALLKGLLFVALPLVGSLLLAFGIWQVVTDLRKVEQRKLLERLREKSSSAKKKQRAVDSLLRRPQDQDGPLDLVLGKLSFVPKLQKMLDQANLDWSATRFLMYLTSASLVVLVGLFVLGYGPMAAAGTAAAVFFLPILVISHRRKKRIKKFVEQLPEVFELLSQALRAGHALASGIGLVAEQLPDPAGTEFARVFHEQNLGVKIEDALLNMADRVDQMDVRFFVTAVLVQRQSGGDLAEVLDKIGTVIRERIQLFGQVQALTAEGRLSGWVLLILPVVVFFVELYVNPEYAQVLIHDPTGKMMTFVVVCMMLMGMAMIKKIVNIKV